MILIPTVLYAGLALYAWIVLCILSFLPITAKSYGLPDLSEYYIWDTDTHALFARNERFYRSARVIQSIVSVVTIPCISAVCASAAVVFAQNQRDAFGLRMRQVITLADRGWMDPAIYFKLIFGGWKRYGSMFLLLAIFIHLVGGFTYPLQALFLSFKTIKTPTSPGDPRTVFDLPGLTTLMGTDIPDDNLVVVTTRRALQTATNTRPLAQLWQRGGVREATLGNISALEDPFYAQLSTGFNTGLIRQFIPRINSTAQYESISEDQFPTGCDALQGAFYVDYDYLNPTDRTADGWRLEACMPADLRQSPWNATSKRQDFSEELYLNVTVYTGDGYEESPPGGNLYKVTVNTTAGYFELPNYMNGGIAGPLLDDYPSSSSCGSDCQSEAYITRRQDDAVGNTTLSSASARTTNKGPLFTTALALFGSGSFLDTWSQMLSAMNASLSKSRITYTSICLDVAPMHSLFLDDHGSILSTAQDIDYCVKLDDAMVNPQYPLVSWLLNFNADAGPLANAFTAASFLANQAWMQSFTYSHTITIYSDPGADSQIPVISLGGIIVGSILLGLYLFPLVALAVYASLFPRWTKQLDAFAMMRLGAAVGDDKLPLLVGKNSDEIKVLDELPGVIRDVAAPPAEAEFEEVEEGIDIYIGRLGLGAGVPLNPERRYRCYPGDHEPLTLEEKRAIQERNAITQ